jgi:NTE family protein
MPSQQKNMTPTEQQGNAAKKSAEGLDFDGQIVIVFQGGGALGAYQVGVYEALHEAGVEPDWVIGTSIGAINAALIAGNKPENRIPRISEFWQTVQSNPPFGLEIASLQPFLQNLMNTNTVCFGVNGFFKPNYEAQLNNKTALGPYKAGYYDTSPLAETLNRLIDFDLINQAKQTRLSLGAVNVLSGKMHYFDSREDRISVANIMASGALPPAFPAVEVDGEPYWDGGIYSNTPLEAVMNDKPRRDSLIFAINLWHSEGEAPQTVAQATGRSKDIQFASRADNYVEAERKLHRLRHIIRELGKHLPAEASQTEQIREMLSWGCKSTMHLVRMSAPKLATEDAYKDIDFSKFGIESRRKAGYDDMCAALAKRSWNEPHDVLDGVVLHD